MIEQWAWNKNPDPEKTRSQHKIEYFEQQQWSYTCSGNLNSNMYGIIDHLPIHNILTSVPCSQSTYGIMRKRQSDDEQTIDGTWMSSENEDFRKTTLCSSLPVHFQFPDLPNKQTTCVNMRIWKPDKPHRHTCVTIRKKCRSGFETDEVQLLYHGCMMTAL